MNLFTNKLITGKTTIELLNEMKEDFNNQIKRNKNKINREKFELKFRKKIFVFFKELYKLGVEIYLEKEEKTEMWKWENVENKDINKLIKLVNQTMKELNKVIEKKDKK